jgi:hypothetical protein
LYSLTACNINDVVLLGTKVLTSVAVGGDWGSCTREALIGWGTNTLRHLRRALVLVRHLLLVLLIAAPKLDQAISLGHHFGVVPGTQQERDRTRGKSAFSRLNVGELPFAPFLLRGLLLLLCSLIPVSHKPVLGFELRGLSFGFRCPLLNFGHALQGRLELRLLQSLPISGRELEHSRRVL